MLLIKHIHLSTKYGLKSGSVFSLALTPQLVNSLAKQIDKVVVTITRLHLLVQLSHEPISKAIAMLKKACRDVVTLVPLIALARLHPVARHVTRPEPHKICNSLNEPVWGLPGPVPLPHVRHLMVRDPVNSLFMSPEKPPRYVALTWILLLLVHDTSSMLSMNKLTLAMSFWSTGSYCWKVLQMKLVDLVIICWLYGIPFSLVK
ncbi:hypothetical protein NL676_038837 [Syzygium grande]|nr:hypothetical protein NL676_038837 [Syzygium grande]